MSYAILQWETRGKDQYADVDGIGRYLIRRVAPKRRAFTVLLNGKVHSGMWPTAWEARDSVEREVSGIRLKQTMTL